MRDIAVLPSSPSKEATNMMRGDSMRTGTEMPSTYLPKAMPSNPSRPMQMGTIDLP